MTIMTNDRQAPHEAHMARGDYASVERALRQLLDERIAEAASIETDDLAWAKLLVDVAVEEAAAGGATTLDEHLSQLDALVRAEAC